MLLASWLKMFSRSESWEVSVSSLLLFKYDFLSKKLFTASDWVSFLVNSCLVGLGMSHVCLKSQETTRCEFLNHVYCFDGQGLQLGREVTKFTKVALIINQHPVFTGWIQSFVALRLSGR